uniref:Tyrosine-protein kinase catalytic domain-containing protein n=1 Tax=Laticauda laticaudata TaxID=8630 RepID=A0A8C5RP31_LATLA
MDIVEHILAVAKVIYDQYQHMKYCKKQKERLIKRMEILLRPIELLQAQPLSKLSSSLKFMLQNMLDLLLEAQELFEKYKNYNMLERFVKAGEILEEFAHLNERFGDMGQGLLLQLQVEQKMLVSFQKYVVSKECCQDLAEDKVCWKEMIKDPNLTVFVQSLFPGQQGEAHTEITEINKDFLTKMTFLFEMKDHILYKGEYYKSPVAVKVFKNPLTTNTKKVREIFEEEIRTLKRLESSYIVRLYGICIDERMVPQFSIITEYCEKGTLREVLRKEQDLPWKIRRDMASDAAAGLYRCVWLEGRRSSKLCVHFHAWAHMPASRRQCAHPHAPMHVHTIPTHCSSLRPFSASQRLEEVFCRLCWPKTRPVSSLPVFLEKQEVIKMALGFGLQKGCCRSQQKPSSSLWEAEKGLKPAENQL